MDINEMHALSYPQVSVEDYIQPWSHLLCISKPVIAAVSGYALGGGLELALMCDLIIASHTAQFGHPEITLGTMPGIGGTQRLAARIGKYRTMELCLTGRRFTAEEAEHWGLVNKVVGSKVLLKEAIALAQKIAGYSSPVIRMIKQAVVKASEAHLALDLERTLFYTTFALEDCQEGMAAFLEKRSPHVRHR